jgi:hypothetical protein
MVGSGFERMKLLLFDKLRALVRVPLKWLVFILVVVVVCYPYPRLLLRHIRHWQDPNALLDPAAPALQPLAEELRHALPPDLAPSERLRRVQKFVLERVPYGWDWETWGMADYLPTVAEALEMGREDCDGRAVVAASLLRALGQEATIVTDFSHVWVRTPMGDLMGPGRSDAIVVTDDGLSLRLQGLAQIPQAFAYGVAVFPWWRELVIIVAAWWLMLRRSTSLAAAVLSLAFALLALVCVRVGSFDYPNARPALQLAGVGLFIAAIAVLFISLRKSDGSLTAANSGPTLT